MTDGDAGAHVRLFAGGLLRVRLAEPVTGHRWQVDEAPEELELVAATYQRANGGAIGAGGVREFLFHARRAGSGSLVLGLQRAWDPPGAAERAFTLTVSVT